MRQTAMLVGIAGVLVLAGAETAGAGGCSMLSAGAAYGTPERLSAFVDGGCEVTKKFSLVFGGQGGMGGGELSAGLDRAVGDSGSSVNLRAALVRTWGRPQGFEVDRSLAGARLQYSVLGGVLSVNAGVLVPLSDARVKAARVTWGVGVGIPLWLLTWQGIGHIEV